MLTTSVTNTGQYTGKETVQLYLQDVVSSVTRPVIELCGIRQVELALEKPERLNLPCLNKN